MRNELGNSRCFVIVVVVVVVVVFASNNTTGYWDLIFSLLSPKVTSPHSNTTRQTDSLLL